MPENPWLRISADDYNGHMSDESVGQLKVLNNIFKKVLLEIKPDSLCVLGSTTGNGFEHVDPSITKSITAIDINNHYLEALKCKFGNTFSGLITINCDLNEVCLNGVFDLIHAALIFEYVDAKKLLEQIYTSLKPDGVLTVVLQTESSDVPTVTETKYHSLKQLASIIKIIEPNYFVSLAKRYGLIEKKNFELDLKTGKKFYVGYFSKK